MSKTVVLVGFSCSGKSTVGKAIAKACKEAAFPVELRDSDEEIGKANGGSIADIFVAKGRPAAIALIEDGERSFLNSLKPSDSPRLVVTGPNFPLREPEWSHFLTRVDPIAYWLQVEPNTVYSRLKRRHDKYRKKFDGEPNNGCWNEGILCDFTNGRWLDLEREEALRRLPKFMERQVELYSATVTGDRAYDSRELTKDDALARLVGRVIADMK